MLIPLVDIENDTPKKGGKGTAHVIKNDGARRVSIINKMNKHSKMQMRNGRFPTIKTTPKLRINTHKTLAKGNNFLRTSL